MRICIDATSLLLRSAGVKNYVYHWIRSLQREATEHTITAFPALGKVGMLDHDRSVLSPLGTIPRIALLHFDLVRNLPRKPKLTGTIYDMTVNLFPEYHTPANVRAEQGFYDRVLKRADGLIAISESSKDDAVRLLGLDPRRIAVIYPGIDERFFHIAKADISRVTNARKLAKPYLLFVGTIEPRKNVDTLLDAWSAVPAEIREGYDLAIAGPIGWASGTTVARLQAGMRGLRLLGYVPESDLPALTAGSAAFVYPSFYEGFGFPVAQAMAAGVPVITSNVSSLPEVIGEAGLLIDPRSVTALSSAIMQMLMSPSLRDQLGHAGAQRAASFTWRNAARQSAEFFAGL
jgi:glycosyltransferase involved in cell wall biosynthesis